MYSKIVLYKSINHLHIMRRPYTFPKSKIQGEIIQPIPPIPVSPSKSWHVPIFLSGLQTNYGSMASVNAGTSNYGSEFEVGLGGINGAFANKLSQYAGQDVTRYKKIHKDLYDAAKPHGIVTANNYTAQDPIQFCLCLRPDNSSILSGIDGTVFIDVFNKAQNPFGNTDNFVMIYVIPPKDVYYKLPQDFKNAVIATSENIIKAVDTFNSQYAHQAKLPIIEHIWMCLFSGSIYRHSQVSVDETALANFQGLSNEIAASTLTSLKKISFENSSVEVTVNGKNIFVPSFGGLQSIIG